MALGDNLPALGVRRPVLITVMNLLIILAGFGGLMGVDVRELPDVDRPMVSVRASYEGASPETMDTEVTSVLEGAVSRVPGIYTIESSSEENNSRIRIEFQPGVDLNVAANDVREAVSRNQQQLPEDVENIFVVKADDEADSIVNIAATSNMLSREELSKRVEKDVAPNLLSIPGVADVVLQGEQRRVMRVLLDPSRLASQQVSVSEVVETLRNARFDVPAGSYRSNDQDLIVRAYASVVEPEKMEGLFIRDGVRLRDVGVVFYGPEQAESFTVLNGRSVVSLGILRQSGANTIAIAQEARERIAEMQGRTPEYDLSIIKDDAVFIEGAVSEVVFSLLFAIVIVLLVIAVFLGQWRATLIPAVTMPVSLIGTIAAIWVLGFSINLLTLLALVLATGLIVDDAIVVLENIQRRRGLGLGKMAAAVLGTRQVFFAVLATTITLVAVFLPIAFLPSQSGKMFREFGMVLSIAVMISSFVALTMCPMMASRLPDLSKENPTLLALRQRLEGIGGYVRDAYLRSLRRVLLRPLMSVGVAVLIALAGGAGFLVLDKELLPTEDRGVLMIFATGPDGTSLSYSDAQAQKIEAILAPYKDAGHIVDVFSTVGRWDKNRTFMIATLPPWEERDFSQQQLSEEINAKLQKLSGAQIGIAGGNSLGMRGGSSRGLEFSLTGYSYEEIAASAHKLGDVVRERIPGVEQVRVEYNNSQPELSFRINRELANDLNVPMGNISQTLRVMVDRFDVVDINVDDEAVPIHVSSVEGAVNDPGDLLNIFVASADGNLIPLTSLVEVVEAGVAAELDRTAQRRAVEMFIGLPPDAALNEAMQQLEEVAAEVLPPAMDIIWRGEAASLSETSHEVLITFLLAFLVVFLVLAAQFESVASALIVIFTVPFGMAAAIFALLVTGQSLNLYSQIGLVMLIGLMTKNAILLVEFMDQLRDEGKSVHDAIFEGVQVRLRPVTMTVLSTVMGALPLILSEGPGAEARVAIGWVVFGGLGLASILTLYLTPLGYAIIAPYVKPRGHSGTQLEGELAQAKREEGDTI
jgi:hydrophobic/amphiphilic exporter-1 (mainly G- bacteria), HAE1 family